MSALMLLPVLAILRQDWNARRGIAYHLGCRSSAVTDSRLSGLASHAMIAAIIAAKLGLLRVGFGI